MSVRHCRECYASKRMETRPLDVDICGICAGEERDPAYVPQQAQIRLRFIKGYHNDEKGIAEMLRQPGQGWG